MKRACALLLVFILLVGCGAQWARVGDWNTSEHRREPFTPVFAGTAFDSALFGACLISPVAYWFGGELSPWFFLASPLPLLDLPFSLIADLCLLPSDIRQMRARGEEGSESEDSPEI